MQHQVTQRDYRDVMWAGRWLEKDCRSQPMSLVPAARNKCLYLPQTLCVYAFTSIIQTGPAWKYGGLGSCLGFQVGGESMLIYRGIHGCGVPVVGVCECCMFVASTELDQQQVGKTSGWAKGDRIWTVVAGRQRGLVSAWEVCKPVCACEPEDCDAFAAPVNFCLCQTKKSRGTGCQGLCLMWVLYLGAVEGSTLSVAVCVTSHVGVLYVCVSMFVCLCVTGIGA